MAEFWNNIREHVSRVWESLSNQQRVMFVGAPSLVFLLLVIVLVMASSPTQSNLVSSQDKAFLGKVAGALDDMGYEYEVGSQAITANADEVDKIRIQLAQQDIIGGQEGLGYKLFDATRLGMTTREFDLQLRRALEEEMATTIRLGSRYDRVKVSISMQENSLFTEDEIQPTASVKVSASRGISQEEVMGIQNLVASGVPGLDPQRVSVHDKNNKKLGGMSDESDTTAAIANTQDKLRMQKETEFEEKISGIFEKTVGSGNYDVIVKLELDWEIREIEEQAVDPETQTEVSGKTYTETSKSANIAGEPGIDTNVQDAGIGAGGADSIGTEISDEIHNYVFTRTLTKTTEEVGEITNVHIGVIVDFKLNEDDEFVARDETELELFKKTIVDGLGLKVDDDANIAATDTCNVVCIEFDKESEKYDLRQQRIERVQRIILQYILPMAVLFAIFWLLYKYLQKAFAPKPIEEEQMEEVPIEPVTESRELSLAQLGLAEFGDIASLPAEEQRRLKMQEHVIHYAQEKPEEVAAIIKAWLTS